MLIQYLFANQEAQLYDYNFVKRIFLEHFVIFACYLAVIYVMAAKHTSLIVKDCVKLIERLEFTESTIH